MRSAHEVAQLIDQMAADVAADEQRLKEALIDLVKAGNRSTAIAVLTDWNEMAAADVLKKYAGPDNDKS